MALLEQAKLNLAKRAAETDFNRLVGKEFDSVAANNELGIRYLHEWIKQDPDRFDNEFRNLQSFMRTQYRKEKILAAKGNQKKVDFFKEQQEQYKEVQDLMKKHGIQLGNMAVLPFSDRIEKMCHMPNAYLQYKNQRVEILADKKAYEKPEEPFHLKMLREEKEEAERQKRLALMGGVEMTDSEYLDHLTGDDGKKGSKNKKKGMVSKVPN